MKRLFPCGDTERMQEAEDEQKALMVLYLWVGRRMLCGPRYSVLYVRYGSEIGH